MGTPITPQCLIPRALQVATRCSRYIAPLSQQHTPLTKVASYTRDKQYKRRVFYSALAWLQAGALSTPSKDVSYEERHYCHNSQVCHSKISVLQNRLLHLQAALLPHHIQPLLYLRLVILHLRWQVAQIVPQTEAGGNCSSLSSPASAVGFLSVKDFQVFGWAWQTAKRLRW